MAVNCACMASGTYMMVRSSCLVLTTGETVKTCFDHIGGLQSGMHGGSSGAGMVARRLQIRLCVTT